MVFRHMAFRWVLIRGAFDGNVFQVNPEEDVGVV